MGKDEKVGWNLAQSIIQEIGDLLASASRCYVRVDFDGMMKNLIAIRLRLVLKEDEIEKLQNIEKGFWVAYNKSTTNQFKNITKEQIKALNESHTKAKQYSDILMALLKEYGYLIPPKEDTTKL